MAGSVQSHGNWVLLQGSCFLWVGLGFLNTKPIALTPRDPPQPISIPGCHWELSGTALCSCGSSKFGVTCLCASREEGEKRHPLQLCCHSKMFPFQNDKNLMKMWLEVQYFISKSLLFSLHLNVLYFFGLLLFCPKLHPSVKFWRSCPCWKTWEWVGLCESYFLRHKTLIL